MNKRKNLGHTLLLGRNLILTRYLFENYNQDTADGHLNASLEYSFGQISYQTRKILSDELESAQNEHEDLLLAWQPVVEDILALGVMPRSTLPAEWFALVEFLKRNKPFNTGAGVNIDLLLERTVLDGQDSDGESQNDDVDLGTSGTEHCPPEEDDG
ncbi:hypothetical protein PtA15_12A84 [Puccinia triticina]|uniref:Uncharacterized protein n=1 Tax=Puccinia triticina TaxID=208348 RepID=A0ABY7CZR2_9BASI|nr:uncharacterized protein PtA15_12A84 [Puccinia triticina]WAQ90099.1 hypothetical protein PtA15_12A84 [Puccinia triticina]WAR61387.1 hypothetical protein PtB15_12B72 [Puccinia triticina]